MNNLVSHSTPIGKYGTLGMFADASGYPAGVNKIIILVVLNPDEIDHNWIYAATDSYFKRSQCTWYTAYHFIVEVSLKKELENPAKLMKTLASRLKDFLEWEKTVYTREMAYMSLPIYCVYVGDRRFYIRTIDEIENMGKEGFLMLDASFLDGVAQGDNPFFNPDIHYPKQDQISLRQWLQEQGVAY